jgi:hypothetical protein
MNNKTILQKLLRNIVIIIIIITALILIQQKTYNDYIGTSISKQYLAEIAFLECRPSQKPVFLKDKNEEYFFIRSGPSSIRLQTSKILDYIEDRKK